MSDITTLLPATVADIAAATGLSNHGARSRLERLRELGQAHVSAWLTNGHGGNPAQIWNAGPGEDAPKPKKPQTSDRAGDWATSETATTLLCHLEHGMLSVKEAAAAAGVNDDAARKMLKQMHRAKAIHIGQWVSSLGFGGHPTMRFALGPGRDARKPRPLTKAQNWNRWANNLRARFGNEVAHRMIVSRRQGGAERIVIDGRMQYQRRSAA